MFQDHRLQQQRFELKYLVSPLLAVSVREYVRNYLELDEYGAGRPENSYSIHSLYLDSPDLRTHFATVGGVKNRYKLRVRYYDGNPEGPVFLEVKARTDNCIRKQRCGIHRRALASVLAGQLPQPQDMLSREPRHHAALAHFQRLMLSIQATPRAHNAYEREAYLSFGGNSVRVTFDRKIRLEPYFGVVPIVEMEKPSYLVPNHVVLELKFTGRFPNWAGDLVREFHLMQTSCAKYSDGIANIGEPLFGGPSRFTRRARQMVVSGSGLAGRAAPCNREMEEAV